MRIAGAQIPLVDDAKVNLETIKASVDWAADNQCDYLLTPEGSLSGYESPSWNINTCKDTEWAIEKLLDYSVLKGVGLVLGTLWLEDKDNPPKHHMAGGTVCNQQRVYDKSGNLLGVHNKVHVTDYDSFVEPGKDMTVVELKTDTETSKVGLLICNDMWGHFWDGHENLMKTANDELVDVVLHSSNTLKYYTADVFDVFYNFHKSALRFQSHASNVPIISVDNCNHIEGNSYNGSVGCPSGFYLPTHVEHQADNVGVQHFYADIQSIQHMIGDNNENTDA